MFNLQSGILRQRFPSTLTSEQAKKIKAIHAVGAFDNDGPKHFGPGEGRHKKAVTGLVVDTLNRRVISCGLDGKLKFWDFLTGYLQDEIDWSPMASIIGSRYYRPSELISLCCDDLSIRVVDTETKKLVRELWGCMAQVSDFCFSNDGRWIIAASLDSVIRVWDLPTGHLINALRTESPCTALAFSDTGEYLATAHADGVGINIWNNRTLFIHVPTRRIREDEIVDAIAPTTSGENGQSLIAAALEKEEEDGEEDTEAINRDFHDSTIAQLDASLQTLSLVPRSRWQTLLHLDAISQRNKPVEPPKAPEKAPFFLPSLSDPLNSSSAGASKPVEPKSTPPSSVSRVYKVSNPNVSTTNEFTSLLLSSTQTSHEPFIAHLLSLSPSQSDIQIRSLSPPHELILFVRALTARLRQKRDYELIQTWMTVFLKCHGESIKVATAENEEGGRGMRACLEEWRDVAREEGARLGAKVGFCMGVVAWVRSER